LPWPVKHTKISPVTIEKKNMGTKSRRKGSTAPGSPQGAIERLKRRTPLELRIKDLYRACYKEDKLLKKTTRKKLPTISPTQSLGKDGKINTTRSPTT